MPFVTIKTKIKEQINLKELNDRVQEQISRPMNGLMYFLQDFKDEDFYVSQGDEIIAVELCIGARHGEEIAKEIVKAIVEICKELYKVEKVLGYIQATPEGMTYLGGEFK